jgi:hypothetical protein
MGTTALGDLPSGALASPNITHASAATDAASATFAAIGANVWRAPQAITIVSAFHEPTGANQDAAHAASYRIFSLIDGSTDGLGTRVLASAILTASQASNTRRSLTTIDVPTVAAGNVVYANYGATVGGTHAGTVVRAGHFSFGWRPV